MLVDQKYPITAVQHELEQWYLLLPAIRAAVAETVEARLVKNI